MLEEFKSWSDDMSKFIGGARNDENKYEKASRGCRKMVSFFREIIEDRRENPSEGFLMDLINASVENDKFSDDELIATCMLILFAGHETTTNLISNGILTLIKNQSELKKLLSNPDLLNLTVEEIMRFDGAVLTKMDTDAKGGAGLSIAFATGRPIVFAGVGQGYDDLLQFDPDWLLDQLFE